MNFWTFRPSVLSKIVWTLHYLFISLIHTVRATFFSVFFSSVTIRQSEVTRKFHQGKEVQEKETFFPWRGRYIAIHLHQKFTCIEAIDMQTNFLCLPGKTEVLNRSLNQIKFPQASLLINCKQHSKLLIASSLPKLLTFISPRGNPLSTCFLLTFVINIQHSRENHWV